MSAPVPPALGGTPAAAPTPPSGGNLVPLADVIIRSLPPKLAALDRALVVSGQVVAQEDGKATIHTAAGDVSVETPTPLPTDRPVTLRIPPQVAGTPPRAAALTTPQAPPAPVATAPTDKAAPAQATTAPQPAQALPQIAPGATIAAIVVAAQTSPPARPAPVSTSNAAAGATTAAPAGTPVSTETTLSSPLPASTSTTSTPPPSTASAPLPTSPTTSAAPPLSTPTGLPALAALLTDSPIPETKAVAAAPATSEPLPATTPEGSDPAAATDPKPQASPPPDAARLARLARYNIPSTPSSGLFSFQDLDSPPQRLPTQVEARLRGPTPPSPPTAPATTLTLPGSPALPSSPTVPPTQSPPAGGNETGSAPTQGTPLPPPATVPAPEAAQPRQDGASPPLPTPVRDATPGLPAPLNAVAQQPVAEAKPATTPVLASEQPASQTLTGPAAPAPDLQRGASTPSPSDVPQPSPPGDGSEGPPPPVESARVRDNRPPSPPTAPPTVPSGEPKPTPAAPPVPGQNPAPALQEARVRDSHPPSPPTAPPTVPIPGADPKPSTPAPPLQERDSAPTLQVARARDALPPASPTAPPTVPLSEPSRLPVSVPTPSADRPAAPPVSQPTPAPAPTGGEPIPAPPATTPAPLRTIQAAQPAPPQEGAPPLPATTVQEPVAAPPPGDRAAPRSLSPDNGPRIVSLPNGQAVQVRVLSVQNTGFTPPSADDAPPNNVTATLVGSTSQGQPIVTTPQGTLVLRARTDLPPGTHLTLALEIPQSQDPATLLPPLDPAQGSDWPAIRQTFAALVAADPVAARTIAAAILPQPTKRLTTNLTFFLTALRGGDAAGWLGGEATEILKSRKGGARLLAQLRDDFQAAAQQGSQPTPDGWRAIPFPFGPPDQVTRAQLHVRSATDQEKGDRRADGPPAQRFLLDLTFSRLGPMQLDGLVWPGRFDLMIRTQTLLPADLHRSIATVFRGSLETVGYAGNIGFQTGAHFWMRVQTATRGSGVRA